MKKFNKILALMFGLWMCALLVVPAFAVPVTSGSNDAKPAVIPCVSGMNLPCISETTQGKSGGVVDYITGTFAGSFLRGFLGIAGITAVIFIMVGGYQMYFSLGNEEMIKTGKNTLVWAVIGLVVVILSAAIVRIITSISF
ncbi:hypothetical protein HZA42_00065 [Candidatus Peregrinibacteria bacterium]|nr:hypothetical protein [Candidatus Peregrinibacteria bacterium]